MMQDTVSLIIPTYNEKENIKFLVERIQKALSGYNYEIVIVDDNSKDGTIDVATELSVYYPVKLLVRRNEKGLSTAVIHGIKNSTGKYICVMDADLQHPPEILPALFKAAADGADMAFASRYVPGGGTRNWGFVRRMISKGATKVSHVLLPSSRRVNDPMTGFFIFKRENVNPDKLSPVGYKIALEILLIGNFKNVAEVPFIFEDRTAGKSKLKAKTQIDYLKHVFSLMRRTGEYKRLVKFIGVGLSGVGVNYIVLFAVKALTEWNQYVRQIPGIEASIITNFLFNDMFTFADRRKGNKASSFVGRLLKFNIVALAGAVIQWGVSALLMNQGMNDYLALLIAIVIAFIWNYFLSTIWAWR
jgi:dolichol-phosphate mannosyltransferase